MTVLLNNICFCSTANIFKQTIEKNPWTWTLRKAFKFGIVTLKIVEKVLFLKTSKWKWRNDHHRISWKLFESVTKMLSQCQQSYELNSCTGMSRIGRFNLSFQPNDRTSFDNRTVKSTRLDELFGYAWSTVGYTFEMILKNCPFLHSDFEYKKYKLRDWRKSGLTEYVCPGEVDPDIDDLAVYLNTTYYSQLNSVIFEQY